MIPIGVCVGIADNSYMFSKLRLDHANKVARATVTLFGTFNCSQLSMRSQTDITLVSGGFPRLRFHGAGKLPSILNIQDKDRNQSPRLINEYVF